MNIRALKFFHNIIHDKVDSPEIMCLFKFLCPRLNARRKKILWLASPRTNVLKASPLFKIVAAVNAIADDFDVFGDPISTIATLKIQRM